MPEQAVAEEEAWVDVAYAAARLGFSAVTIWRCIRAGAIPMIRAGQAIKIPREFVEDARAVVMAGGQVVLSEFAQQWSARNRIHGAVAS